MDKSLIEKYKNEMLKMYRSQKAVPAMAQEAPVMPQNPSPPATKPPITATVPNTVRIGTMLPSRNSPKFRFLHHCDSSPHQGT